MRPSRNRILTASVARVGHHRHVGVILERVAEFCAS